MNVKVDILIPFKSAEMASHVCTFNFIGQLGCLGSRATYRHYDWFYMGRGSTRPHTSWIPLMNVLIIGVALVVLTRAEASELISTYAIEWMTTEPTSNLAANGKP